MKSKILLIVLFASVAGLISGCATTRQPLGQEHIRMPDMRPPVCFHSLPLESLFGLKEIAGVRLELPAAWIAQQGFSKIGNQVIPRTTFPAAINGHWGWFIGSRENPFVGVVLIPEIGVNHLTPSDVYLITEKANVYLKIGQEKIDWMSPLDFSPKNDLGRKNLIALLSRFSATEDGTIATDLDERNFVNARKASNIFRRVGGAAPTISSALIIPVVWPFYFGNWVLNAGMTENHLGGSFTASVKDIREYLGDFHESNEKSTIVDALDERSRKEKS